jgi:Rieske Fe-S protein
MEPTGVDPAGRPVPRRRFIRMLLGFSALSTLAMVATPIIGFLIPPRTAGAGTGGRVLAATTADLPIGSGKVVAMGSKPVIVVNTSGGVKAYSAVCTHLGCIVGYDTTSNHIVCPCHDGHFNPASGGVISGPPPQPLPSVAVTVEKDQIFLVSS